MVYENQMPGGGAGTFTKDYVKATTVYGGGSYPDYEDAYWEVLFQPWFATDPSTSEIGSWGHSGWAANEVTANQRFHIDLGESKTIKRIYFVNDHFIGYKTSRGVKDFTFWGSNNAAAFVELTYATDTNWTQISTYSDAALTSALTAMPIHPGTTGETSSGSDDNTASPTLIYLSNSTAYRYYAFKFANNHESIYDVGFRKVFLQALTGGGFEVNGVSFDNIAEVNGVAIASISEVEGVTK